MTIRYSYKNFWLAILIILSAKTTIAQQSFIKENNGIVVHLSQSQNGVQAIRLQVINDHIIRIIAAADSFSTTKSLIVNDPNQSTQTNWKVAETDSTISVQTSAVTATVNKETSVVLFYDAEGKLILSEKKKDGKRLTPAVFDGKPFYNIRQTFTTTPDDAIYGLGQHQDGKVNYRNQQVWLFQNNTEVAVPFLISNKHYGILWDNYSLTKVGDVRDYLPLDRLMLFSKNDEQGWLTASYFNDKTKTDKADIIQAESHIDYPFLGDTKRLPKDFNISKGMIRWEGAVQAGIAGMYKFRFTYAGYYKVWMDGKEVANAWRQAWNPGLDVINMSLEKDKKYTLKIEWIPDGGESYLSAKWLPPVEDNNDYTFSSDAGKQLDYYFVYGANMDSVISGYRYLTGKATLTPKWASGFWQSRERYKTEDEIVTTAKTFREKKIPIDNIVLDWSYWKQDQWGSQEFDKTRFPSVDSMITALHKNYNMHFMISVWPKFYEGIEAYKTFDKNGWLYKRNIANRQRDWIAQGYVSTFYDAFNPAARKGFWDLINQRLYSKGIDAWWMDASEPDVLSNVSSAERIEEMTPTAAGPAAAYLNAYPMLNAKGIYEGQRSVDANKRVFILTRSAFAGSQQYGASVWSGDIASRWEDMKDQIAAGINFSLLGLPNWTMDIGGFATEQRYNDAKGKDIDEWRELNTRWYQFGAFCPLFRVHGQYPFREIYNIAPGTHPAYQSMLYYNKLRYRLLPYIYSIAGWSNHKDYTIIRGLAMDSPNDSVASNVADQFMFGPSLLINPVYTYGALKRSVYLPSGSSWYDFYSGKYATGGQTIEAAAPYERMPLYVKEGSIIPVGPALQYTNEKPADVITLYVYTGSNASFDLYEDDGVSYDYEKGAFTTIPIRYDEASRTLTIGKREGSFTGMLTKRTFSVVWISKNKPVGFDADRKGNKTVTYEGGEMKIK